MFLCDFNSGVSKDKGARQILIHIPCRGSPYIGDVKFHFLSRYLHILILLITSHTKIGIDEFILDRLKIYTDEITF